MCLAPPVRSEACGERILSQNFDHYGGSYKVWSREEAEADFDVGRNERPSAAGNDLTPGISFGRGFENADVGEGNIRMTYPEGTCHPSKITQPARAQAKAVVLL